MASKTDVKYVGRYQDGVDVLMPAGNWKHVPFEGVLSTSEEHAESLLTQQGEWEAAVPSAKTQKEEK